MTAIGRWGRTAGVVATGVVAAAVLAGAAAVGQDWVDRWTGAEQTAVSSDTRDVAVDPVPQTLVCPRPVSLPRGADVGDEQFRATPQDVEAALAAAATGAEPTPTLSTLDGADPAELTTGPDAAVTGRAVEATQVLRATPVTGEGLRMTAAFGAVTTAGDLRGLAAASCRTPATEHWLVGGQSTVGSSALLTVQNPSAQPAAVTLTVHGPNGPVAVGGRGAFTVAPGEQEVVRLDSVAADQRRLAVHVAASGARVTASLQTQAIDGLVPAGVDLVAPGAEPAGTVAVTGVVSRGEALDDDRAPVLWLLAPGDRSAVARITVLGPQGPVTLRGAEQMDLTPGVVHAVPLGGLEAGTYTVVVDADEPVVAAARTITPGEPEADSVVDGTPHDVTWHAGQALPDVGAPVAAQVAIPPVATTATAVLTAVPADQDADDATGEFTATVRGLDDDGAVAGEQEVTVPVGATIEVPAADVGATTAVLVDSTGDRSGNVLLTWSLRLQADDGTGTDGTLTAALEPTTSAPIAAAVTVRRVDVP